MPRTLLLLAYFCSGGAGLVYELVWSRYLALFVGQSAQAAVLVIAMFLGGMSVGAFLVGRRSRDIEKPIAAYAALEVLLAVVGLAFHGVFTLVTDFSYDILFPALPGPGAIQVAKWAIAGPLVFVPSVLLGATFPLMAAGLIRQSPERPGRSLAALYFVNSLGGAAGLLFAGFFLIGAFGLAGTSGTAAALNVTAALLAVAGAASKRGASKEQRQLQSSTPFGMPAGGAGTSALFPLLITASAVTALASFVYEIGWIRMLSLAMGSATHSFELMLSAFILGLALGALAIRGQADRSTNPVALLGYLQWLMGFLALATLPVYAASFGWIGDLVVRLPTSPSGYLTFNVARYGIALLVMLPATFLAGTTLPLITNTLLRAGVGERAIGWVYSVNTAGSILGVALAGLILLPVLGLKGMIVAGAAVDMSLGVVLLMAARRASPGAVERVRSSELAPALPGSGHGLQVRGRQIWGLTAASVAALGISAGAFELDRALLTGGIYRFGNVAERDPSILYYADGRSSTIGVHVQRSDSLVVLTANGKPDASLTTRWIRAATESVAPEAINQPDESTQMLAALVSGAYAEAGAAAVIGQGSGMSGHFLLADPKFASVVTVEIEPRVIDASYHYYPANARVFDDPRSRIAIGDAKSYFAHARGPYDLILSEPSNPWVSGVAGLFSQEFYERVDGHLSDRGVFAQWFQSYETNDGLVSSILAALYREFGDFHGYLVGPEDLLVVATRADELRDPDWSLLEDPALERELSHLLPITGRHLAGLKVFTRAELAPLLEDWGTPNSDYRPVLDLGSERARFLGSAAEGLQGLTEDPFRIAAALGGWTLEPASSAGLPMPRLPPQLQRASAFLAREALVRPDRAKQRFGRFVGTAETAVTLMQRLGQVPADSTAQGWDRWVAAFVQLNGILHSGSAGFAEPWFYGSVRDALARTSPPTDVHATVAFFHGLASWDWEEAAAGATTILAATGGGAGQVWSPPPRLGGIPPAVLLDGAVVAGIKSGNVDLASLALRQVAPLTGRSDSDLRLQLLRAHVRVARSSGSR